MVKFTWSASVSATQSDQLFIYLFNQLLKYSGDQIWIPGDPTWGRDTKFEVERLKNTSLYSPYCRCECECECFFVSICDTVTDQWSVQDVPPLSPVDVPPDNLTKEQAIDDGGLVNCWTTMCCPLECNVHCTKQKKKKTWRFTPLANQCNVTFKSLTTVWNATRPAPHHQVLCFWAAEPYHVLSLRVFGSYAACMRHRCSFNTPNRVFTGLELHPQRQRVFSVYHHDLLRSRSLIKSFHLTERLNKWYSTNYGLISHSSNIDVSPN